MAVGWYAAVSAPPRGYLLSSRMRFVRLCRGLLVDPAVWLLSSVAVSVILWANARSVPARRHRAMHDNNSMDAPYTEPHSAEAQQLNKEAQNHDLDHDDDAAGAAAVTAYHQQHQYISMRKAVLLPVLGSAVLLVLFFVLNIVKYVFFVVLALSSLTSLTLLLEPVCARWLRGRRRQGIACGVVERSSQARLEEGEAVQSLLSPTAVTEADATHCWLPRVCQRPSQRLCRDTLGVSYVSFSAVCAFGGAVIMLVLWLTTNHWLVLDVLAISLAVTSLSSLRLQSIKVSLVFLLLFFLYDIFWVFLSSYFFKESVMSVV